MAITIPSNLELLDENALIGHVPTGTEPLHTIMRRTNWHYARHSPALVNVAPIIAAAASNTIVVPAYASADGLTYQSQWIVWSQTAVTCSFSVEWATAGGGPWNHVTGSPFTSPTLNALATKSFTQTFTLPSTTRFLRLSIYSGSPAMQLQTFACYPDAISSITAGTKASGFIAYDDAALQVVSDDAPIHTEYFNRAKENIRTTMADRRHCVFSFAQDASYYAQRYSPPNAETVVRIAYAPYWLGNVKTTQQVTVYAKATDTGTPDGSIVIGQDGSDYAALEWVANGTHHQGTLTLDPAADPAIYVNGKDITTALEVEYVFIDWSPALISSDAVISSPAPPPLREYLQSVEDVTLSGCISPYATTGLNFEPALSPASSGDWEWGFRFGPATRALWAAVTKSTVVPSSAAANDPYWFNQSSGITAADRIFIAAQSSGAEQYPLSSSAVILWGCQDWDPTPTGTGTERLCEVILQRTPRWEPFVGQDMHGFGGIAYQEEDLASVP